MLPDRVSNPGPLTYESGALPIALRGPAEEQNCKIINQKYKGSVKSNDHKLIQSNSTFQPRQQTGNSLQRRCRGNRSDKKCKTGSKRPLHCFCESRYSIT